ncbi:MAG: hypothetical protein EA381_01615 [Planctomycetaceae bacterium]|nr:MAG: hypothetical protein EA381_01615 [Planctomycetaceae bacterium]
MERIVFESPVERHSASEPAFPMPSKSDLQMNSRRALLAVLIAGGQSLSASAGCFDWLFGCKTTPQPTPFAVGVMPQTTITPLGPPVPVGQPFVTAPQSSMGFVQPMGGAVAQFPVAGTQAHAMAFSGNFVSPMVVNNPSVLSGMPVNPNAPQVSAFRGMAQPMQTAPVTNTWWGATAPQTSFNAAAAFNAPAASGSWTHPMQVSPTQPPETSNGWMGMKHGNSYQTTYNNVPTTVYRPVQQIDPATGQMVIVQQPCQTTTQQVQRTPTSTLQHVPTTPPASPYSAEPGCGNEFPGHPGGVTYPTQPTPQTNYQGSTSYPGATGPYDANGYGSGVSQATSVQPPVAGYGSNGYDTNGYGNSQIPSTAPQPLSGSYSGSGSTDNGYYGQGSSTSPGTSASPSYPTAPSYPTTPAAPSSPNGSGGYGDASAVEQPRLQAPPLGSSGSNSSGSSSSNYPPDNGSSNNYSSGGSSSSSYPSGSNSSNNYSSGDSTSGNYGSPSGGSSSGSGSGAGRYDSSSYSGGNSGNSSTPSNPVSSKYSDLPPIPAADDYEPPAWNGNNPNGNRPQPGSPAQPGQPGSATPRISPPSWADRTAMRTNEPLREPGYDATRRGEATSNRAATPSAWQRASFPPANPPAAAQPPKRDTGGWVPANPSGY